MFSGSGSEPNQVATCVNAVGKTLLLKLTEMFVGALFHLPDGAVVLLVCTCQPATAPRVTVSFYRKNSTAH